MTALVIRRADDGTVVDEDDGCDAGNHLRDELCARTRLDTLPPVDQLQHLIGMAVHAVDDAGNALTSPDHRVTAAAGPDADGMATLTVERPLSPPVTKWLGLPEPENDRGGAT